MDSNTVWLVVGVVFVAEYVLPKVGAGIKWCFEWLRDLRELREDLYESDDDSDEEYADYDEYAEDDEEEDE